MPLSDLDRQRLGEALALAESVVGLTDPNPRVGCVLGTGDGQVLGQGATQQIGGPHAEVMALRDATSRGHDVRNAIAWVTLEPCAHHGRTPPCCDALIAAGLSRVVAAIEDPFPDVAGGGIARLRAAGIEVTLADGAIAEAARALNIGFFSRIVRGRPWVRLKAACSLDGRTALPNGVSQWITGPEARADGHAWRRRASVVLTGVGTVLADDPHLDVRLVQTPRQPMRAVLDSRLRTPPEAHVLRSAGTLIYTASAPAADARARLEARGAEVIAMESEGGRPDPARVVADLAGRLANEVHVEAGATLSGALIAAGLVDELLLYVAPLLVGPGSGIAHLPALPDLGAGHRFAFVDRHPCGQDLRLRLVTAASDPDRWLPLDD